ncbi:ATP-binding protein [Natranaeroarchaeum sulfidigenes]|uniref:DNA mismatch repair enzyme (Predicted ATPase) n=1 Tax=Natranaeroarchaeum sulfidigenes TaxID=2784880 RepID=A0A897MQJ2_9EURY|nr:ATP-binding protein [Natranaeroarchaeum sulfidigenes]QSG02807.1 DNA mismatch repair enzyme (predicted ATPase) [Natranaeroarchaeum sulfidigenes]
MKKSPKVNEVNEFLEIASDFEDPLEVIRESLSNSYDAGASEVKISIRNQPEGSDIIIEDDGHGMNERDLESFFDLGNSRKTDSIGYKGHGTKIFYKSDHIEVTTVRDGKSYRAVMEEPWEKLNRKELPKYELTKHSVRSGNSQTKIKITNFRSGKGFNAEELTYNKIHHYLKWKTIAGSLAHKFGEFQREMDIIVELDEDIDDTRDKLVTTNRLELPEEQEEPGDGRFPAERMCKHYPAEEIDVEYDGGETTVQIVGMVGGKKARNELPTYGKHSSQFGVWLAKDHIKVERHNEAISHDNEYIHFFFVANCQDIELSANRETIRNKSSSVYQAVTEEIEYYLSKVMQDPWFKEEYLQTRKEGKHRRRMANQQSSLKERRERIEADGFNPANSSEVLLGLERAVNGNASLTLSVEDFQPDADVHAIVRHAGRLRNAAVHPTLTGLLNEEVPLENVDLAVCWTQGDPAELKEYERNGYIGGELSVQLENGALVYRDGENHYTEVIEVKPLLESKVSATADD